MRKWAAACAWASMVLGSPMGMVSEVRTVGCSSPSSAQTGSPACLPARSHAAAERAAAQRGEPGLGGAERLDRRYALDRLERTGQGFERGFVAGASLVVACVWRALAKAGQPRAVCHGHHEVGELAMAPARDAEGGERGQVEGSETDRRHCRCRPRVVVVSAAARPAPSPTQLAKGPIKTFDTSRVSAGRQSAQSHRPRREVRQPGRRCPRRRRRELCHRAGRDGRPGRRIGLRQELSGALAILGLVAHDE